MVLIEGVKYEGNWGGVDRGSKVRRGMALGVDRRGKVRRERGVGGVSSAD